MADTRADLRVVSSHDAPELGHRVYGAADPQFSCALRAFSSMFPLKRLGGGALSVYLDGQPVLDAWTGWADRRGNAPWSANTAPMVFSATKGLAATVIHRLADRGLIDYEAPVADYWPEFAAGGKAAITVREIMEHTTGLSGLRGATLDQLLDHRLMEQKLAAAAPGKLRGSPAYHALTFGWLMSGLARSVTGKSMRTLFREELAAPLNTDGIHLGRPPAGSPTRAAQIIMPQTITSNSTLNWVIGAAANNAISLYRSMYFPGAFGSVQGDIAMLDAEMPAANGVVTARALARMYGAIANGGEVDGVRFLSAETVARLRGRRSLRVDKNLRIPMSFNLGYHSLPAGLPGFGHVGLGGSVGWADPDTGFAFAFVNNRLLTPLVVSDPAGILWVAGLLRQAALKIRSRGVRPVSEFGAPYPKAGAATTAG